MHLPVTSNVSGAKHLFPMRVLRALLETVRGRECHAHGHNYTAAQRGSASSVENRLVTWRAVCLALSAGGADCPTELEVGGSNEQQRRGGDGARDRLHGRHGRVVQVDPRFTQVDPGFTPCRPQVHPRLTPG